MGIADAAGAAAVGLARLGAEDMARTVPGVQAIQDPFEPVREGVMGRDGRAEYSIAAMRGDVDTMQDRTKAGSAS